MRWFWTFWILSIAGTFAVAEGYALTHDKTTLSRYVWELSHAWPLLPFVVGIVVGCLACHFWWGGIVPFEPVKKHGSK